MGDHEQGFFSFMAWVQVKDLKGAFVSSVRADGDPAQGKITGVSKAVVDFFHVFDASDGMCHVLLWRCHCLDSVDD